MNTTGVSIPSPQNTVEQTAIEYVTQNKHWRRDEYRIERHGQSADKGREVVWAVFLKDEVHPVPGEGKSVELHIDPKTMRVVAELGFQ